MEEQFILRVPPSVAERIERLLNENASSSEDGALDLSFSDMVDNDIEVMDGIRMVIRWMEPDMEKQMMALYEMEKFQMKLGGFGTTIAQHAVKSNITPEDGRSGTFQIGNDSFPASLLDLPAVVESYKTYDDNVLIKTADIGQIIMVNEEGDPATEGIEYKHGLTPPMRDARRRRFRREPDLNPEVVQRVEKDLLKIMSGGSARAPVVKPDVVPVEPAGEPERSDSDESG